MPKHTFASTFARERVDRAAGIIKGVAVITEGPALGHIDQDSGLPLHVDGTTLRQMLECAGTYSNGVKVKADHRSGIFAVTGHLKNFRIEGKVLRADLHVLSSDENREKLMEMAETIPDTFGLSVSFSGPDDISGNKALARCVEIYSADLVSEPAANPTGLFSAQVDPTHKGKPMDDPLKQCEAMLSKFAAEFNTKLTAFQQEIAALKSASPTAELTSLKEKNTQLEQKVSDLAKTVPTIESIAREFTKVVGTSPAPGTSPAAGGGEPKAPKLEDVGEELVQKHYAATRSKPKAFALAGAENSKAVEALVKSGRNVRYEKPAEKAA